MSYCILILKNDFFLLKRNEQLRIGKKCLLLILCDWGFSLLLFTEILILTTLLLFW